MAKMIRLLNRTNIEHFSRNVDILFFISKKKESVTFGLEKFIDEIYWVGLNGSWFENKKKRKENLLKRKLLRKEILFESI